MPTIVFLAPMSGISDLPFRRAAARQGAAYVVSEMVASEALAQGRPDVVRRAAFDDDLPLRIMQLVGREARWMAHGARIAEAAGADIIDINMGCPAREVTGGLSGSALMRDLDHAERLLSAVTGATHRPVTLKMRLGWDDASRNAPELARRAEQCGIRALTVHGRTRQQFFQGMSDWSAVRAVKSATALPVIVNGDIVDATSARSAFAASGADAVMIGRAALGRPWIAGAVEQALAGDRTMQGPSAADQLESILDHFLDALRFYGDRHGVRTFRKHLAKYVAYCDETISESERRSAASAMCRLESPHDIERAVTEFWRRLDEARSIRHAALRGRKTNGEFRDERNASHA